MNRETRYLGLGSAALLLGLVNAQAEALFGWSREELIGSSAQR